jgi:hypothetical protein
MAPRPRPAAMLAAPNRSRIRGVVQHAAPSQDSSRKWALQVRLDVVESLYGGTFVHPGETVAGIAFDLPEAPAAGARMTAEAEHVGGPRGGTVRIPEVQLTAP